MPKVLITSFKYIYIYKKLVQFYSNSKNERDFLWCIFQGFHAAFYYKSHEKLKLNQNTTKKIFKRHCRNSHKRKLKNIEFSSWSCMDFIHTYVFVHPQAYKARWMKKIQVKLSSVLIPEEQNWHHWFILLVYLQRKNVYLQRQKYTICYAILWKLGR